MFSGLSNTQTQVVMSTTACWHILLSDSPGPPTPLDAEWLAGHARDSKRDPLPLRRIANAAVIGSEPQCRRQPNSFDNLLGLS